MPKNITFEIGGKPYSVTWTDPSDPTPADIDEMEMAVRAKYKLPLAKPASTGPTPGNGSMLRMPQGMLPIDATVKNGPVAIPQPKAVDPMLAGLMDTSKLKGITGNGVSTDEETRNRAQGRTTDQRNRAVLVQTQDQQKQPLLSRSQVNAAAIIKANKARQINKPIPPSANPNYTGETDAATAYGELPKPNTSRGSSSDIGRKMAQRGLNKVTGGVVTALMPGIAGAMNDKDRAKFAEGIGEGTNRLANDAAMFVVPGYGGAQIAYQVAPMIGESLKTGSTQPLIDGIGGFAEGLNVTGDKPLYDRVQAGINLVLTAVGIGHGLTELRAMHDGFSTGRITAKQIAKIAKEDPRVHQILTDAGYKPNQIADIVNQSAEITPPKVSTKPKITGTERPAPTEAKPNIILGKSQGAPVDALQQAKKAFGVVDQPTDLDAIAKVFTEPDAPTAVEPTPAKPAKKRVKKAKATPTAEPASVAPVEATQPAKPVPPVETPNPAETPAEAKPKEPWEMTVDEYANQAVGDGVTRERAYINHKKAVDAAVKAKKPVPENVLAEYRDAEAKQAVTPESSPDPVIRELHTEPVTPDVQTPKESAQARVEQTKTELDQALNKAARRVKGRQAGSALLTPEVMAALINHAKAHVELGVESAKEWLKVLEDKYGKSSPKFIEAIRPRVDEVWANATEKPKEVTPTKPKLEVPSVVKGVVTEKAIKPSETAAAPNRQRAPLATETDPNNVTGARHSLMDQERIKGTTIEQHAEAGKAKLDEVGESGVMAAVHASNESGKAMSHAEASAAQIIQNNIERRSRALEAKGITSGAEIEKLIAQKQAVNRALKIYGHEFNTIGNNLQQARDMHGSLVNFLTAMQDAKGEKLTPSEHKDYAAMYQQIADLQAKVDAHEATKTDLEKQLAAEKAKKNIETLRTENAARSKGRKDTAEQIAARKAEALRKGFRALQGQASSMGFDRLAAAAPHFKDAAVELGKQGKVKLSDVVDSLVTEAKVAGIKVTEREVLGMLAGEYDPKPNKAKERVESIRKQAQKELQTETRKLERKVKATEYVEQQAKASMDRAQKEKIKVEEFAKKKAAAADAKFHADQARRQLAALKKIQAAADKEWNLKDKIEMGEAKLKARKELQQARAEYVKEWKNSIQGKREALFERLQAAESALMSPPQIKTPKPKLPPELLDLTIKLNAAKFKAKQMQERVQAKADYDLLTQGEKNKEAANQLLGASRTALTSIDRSAMLRQGLFLAISHARIIPKVIMDQYHAGKSEVNYTQVMGDVMTNPYFDKALNAELDLGGLTGRRGGEFFRSDLLSRPVKVKGRDVNAFARSERAYDAAIVSTRMQAFALEVHALEKFHGRGLDIDELKLVAEHINQVSGSGTGPTAQHLKGLVGSNLFAPGYLVSKFQTATGAALRKAIAHGKKTGDYSIAKVQAMNYAKFLASAGAAAYLLSDDHDPKSSRFLTRRIGNQRVNLMGSLQQPLIMFSQLAFGTTDAKGKHHPPDWEKTFGNFATGKEGVGLRVAQSVAEKKSYGKNTDIKTVEGAGNIAKSMFVPISIQNAQDIWSDPKLSTIEKAALTTAAYFGVDVNQQPKGK